MGLYRVRQVMANTFEIQMTGGKAAQAMLKKAAFSIKNPKPMYKKIAGELLSNVMDNFDRQGYFSLIGQHFRKWHRLAKSTLRDRARYGHTGKILHRSGGSTKPKIGRGKKKYDGQDLRGSITSAFDRYMAKVGTNVFYGIFHELGTSEGHKRSFLLPTKHGVKDIFRIITRFVMPKRKGFNKI